VLCILIAHGLALDAPHHFEPQQPLQDGQRHPDSARWEDAARTDSGNEQDKSEEKRHFGVDEATEILRKIKRPSVSKLAKYTQKPKGVFGTTAYYAKEAFVLLFMNAPKEDNLISTKSQTESVQLPQPLSKAVRLLEDAAAENNTDAIHILAELSFYGNYTHPVNYERAFERYKQLAELDGNSTAQYMLGFMYATGLNPKVPADQAKSLLYHTFAAEQGDTRSQMTLAYRHHAGISTPRNCDEAVHWYQRVADKAIIYYRSGPPGGHSLIRDSFHLADEAGGVYGEGASVSSAGALAKHGGPTSDAYADPEDVMEYLHFQASKGDYTASFGLARVHYDGGRGMPRDLRLAKTYFMAVARHYWDSNGHIKNDVTAGMEKLASKSAGYLGRMFLRGEGTEQSFSKAKIWFTRGLANGDALCQYSMGLMYRDGLGVEKNIKKASEYFGAAADQDLAVAQTNLGILFLDQGDIGTATHYFDFAARNGHIEAFFYLAEMNNQGLGRDRSCGTAAVQYKIVAEKAEAIWGSIDEANEAYEEGDNQKALIHYLMAAEQGSENAQANVAWLLDHSRPRWSPIDWLISLKKNTETTVGDAALALVHWTRSARQHNIDSLVKAGDYYLYGIGAVASPENAAACYQAAGESLQSAQAFWNLGWMHENGVGIDQDFHLAKRFYDHALEINDEAYLPVMLSLWKLRWRSWWNTVTRGGIKGINDEPGKTKRLSLSQWLEDFLKADAEMNAQYEADDWETQYEDPMPGGDDTYYDDGDIDDDVFVTLMLGGLLAALGWLIWHRQQLQRAAEARRQQGLQQGEQQAPVPEQQPDRGVFPQPGQLGFNDWVAGGVGH
jgi:SEL1 protein